MAEIQSKHTYIIISYEWEPSQKISTHTQIENLYAPHATVWIYIVISQRTSQSGNVKSGCRQTDSSVYDVFNHQH